MKTDYVLEWLDDVITGHLQNEKLCTLSDSDTEQICQRAKEEKTTIRRFLMRRALNADDEKSLEVFIPHFQQALIQLLSTLDVKKKTASCVRNCLKETIEELLEFVERFFVRYFDREQMVPAGYLRLHKQRWRVDQLKWGPEVMEDEVLYEIIKKAAHRFLSSSEMSYAFMAYADEFFKALGTELTESVSVFPGVASFQLYYLNFNDAAFISYLIKHLADNIDTMQGEEKRILVMQFAQYVQLQQLKPGFSYYKELPDVTQALMRWINFRLLELESKTNAISIMDKQDSSKINLSVSVSMLALFIRLLTEEKIIINKNQAELIRFFAENFSTTRQEHISADSLYGSYFKPQPGTVRMMQDCLSRIQQTLVKKF